MRVEFRLFATLREAAGERALARTYDADEPVTVRDVLGDLEAAVPTLEGELLDADGDVRSSVTVLRNGRNVAHEAGADTELDDGDRLSLTPPVSGGRA